MPNTDFYELLKKQNNILTNSNYNVEELYSTDNNKFKYKYTEMKNMTYITDICFYIYYAILFFFIIILYFSTKNNWKIKVIIILIFLGYPFYIYYIENILYKALSYTLEKV